MALTSDAEAEALIHSLHARDYGIEAVVEQEAVGRLATVRLTRSLTPGTGYRSALRFVWHRDRSMAEAEPMELHSRFFLATT